MREFNTTGICVPEQHYMVNLDERIKAIKKLVDSQKYFVMNRARQYGKTTTLFALEKHLLKDYFVVSLDFQKLGNKSFADEVIFSKTFADIFSQKLMKNKGLSGEMHDLLEKLHATSREEQFALYNLFSILSELCQASPRPIVLMIDEVDSATNNQVFLDFLAQLRAYYMERFSTPTFQSVILAGVYDIKNLKRKIRTDEEHKINSPWNIATEFDMDMSFSAKEIEGMLSEYENDYHTGMDISCMSKRLYDYTSGYPFLVSKLCKYMAEQYESDGIAWTTDGFLTAERKLLNENNTLFDSLTEKLAAYPQLNDLVFSTLFRGDKVPYNAYNEQVAIGIMFGFLKNKDNTVVVANRIFETWLYNLYLSSEEMKKTDLVQSSISDKNQFIVNGFLNMKLVMEKFVQHFHEIYANSDDRFIEDNGTRFFLLYLRPIINGTGNYYVEAQTRTKGRTDVIVDYHGEQYIIEMKLWHGIEYNERGEKQLIRYLEDYGQDKGYMLSFNFNKNKQIGVHTVRIGDKEIIEAVV